LNFVSTRYKKNVFLCGDLEEVFLEQAPKIYGLEQSSS
jgi:hypothetical protein